MTHWVVEFQPEAENDLARINSSARRRVIDKLDWLEKNFDDLIPLSLTGGYKGFYKLRVGDWRAIYQVNWKSRVIIVWYIDHPPLFFKWVFFFSQFWIMCRPARHKPNTE